MLLCCSTPRGDLAFSVRVQLSTASTAPRIILIIHYAPTWNARRCRTTQPPCLTCQVLQALWDGSAGGKLGKQQRLEKLCALWGAVAWVGRGEKVPAYDDPEESESANELADKLLRKIGHML